MTENIVILIIISAAGMVLLVTGFTLLQVRNRNRLLQREKQLAESQVQHQKELLESVITSQETERRRIGMDLHDEVGAALSTLRIKIEHFASEQAAGSSFLSGCKTDIDSIITNMRNISHNLSPRMAGNFGFYDAIHELSDRVNRSGKVEMNLRFDEDKLPVFKHEQAAMALYRVVAELVNNTLKHANASRISLDVDVQSDRAVLEYRDNGKGLPETKGKGMGLQNIESRLSMIEARFQLFTPAGGGYGMKITIPLN